MRTCPICQEKLQKRTYKGVNVDECPQNHGMFFDRGELTRAKDSADPDLSFIDFDLFDTDFDKQQASDKVCPYDSEEMVSVHYGNSHVLVDLCPKCHGVWLDQKEFEKILSYLAKFVDSQSVEDLSKMSAEQFKEIFTGEKDIDMEVHDFFAVTNLLETRYASEHPTLGKWIEVYYKYTPFR